MNCPGYFSGRREFRTGFWVYEYLGRFIWGIWYRDSGYLGIWYLDLLQIWVYWYLTKNIPGYLGILNPPPWPGLESLWELSRVQRELELSSSFEQPPGVFASEIQSSAVATLVGLWAFTFVMGIRFPIIVYLRQMTHDWTTTCRVLFMWRRAGPVNRDN